MGGHLARPDRRPAHSGGDRRLGTESFWRTFFLTDHPLLSKIWGPLVGPIVAMLSFLLLLCGIAKQLLRWRAAGTA